MEFFFDLITLDEPDQYDHYFFNFNAALYPHRPSTSNPTSPQVWCFITMYIFEIFNFQIYTKIRFDNNNHDDYTIFFIFNWNCRNRANVINFMVRNHITIPIIDEFIPIVNFDFSPAIPQLQLVTPANDFCCSICLERDPTDNVVAHPCGNTHHFHRQCIVDVYRHGNDRCPYCRGK